MLIYFFGSRRTVSAYTENDLREVMGYERYDNKDALRLAKKLISDSSQDEMYNHLLQVQDETTVQKENITKDLVIESRECLLEEVAAGIKIDDILKLFSQYDTIYLTAKTEYEVDRVDLTPIDESDIHKKQELAKFIEIINETSVDIGKVGVDMEPVVGGGLRIKSMGVDTITVYTSEDEIVRSQFNGTVKEVTNDSVTIQSGETILLIYQGIKSQVHKDDAVKQGATIGRTKQYDMSLTMNMVSQPVNPLLAYGKRAIVWYDTYKQEDPWNKLKFDFENIKDHPDKQVENEQVVVGEVKRADGTTGKLTVEGDVIAKGTVIYE